MLSVFIDAEARPRHLALSLEPLVSAAVEGLVLEVVLVDRGLDAETRALADYAGCRIAAPDRLGEAFANARGDWLFFMECGARPLPGWMREIADHVGRVQRGIASPQAARLRPAAMDRRGFLSRVTNPAGALEGGLVLKKAQAIGLLRQTRPAPLETLAKGLATTRLKAEMRPKRAADAEA